MNKWVMWAIPYAYVKSYVFLMIAILFILPVVTGLRYTSGGYMVNYLFADALFYRWCRQKIEEDKAAARKRKFLGEENDVD
jgi:hypothetical protein